MRIWTVHPKYLDSKGLVAVWRETLLAQKVLRGETKGYKSHPQLHRFRAQKSPLACISSYLEGIYEESLRRGYNFNEQKMGPLRCFYQMQETSGQLRYEWKHLLRKLEKRAPERYEKFIGIEQPEAHPLFEIVSGKVRDWERVKD